VGQPDRRSFNFGASFMISAGARPARSNSVMVFIAGAAWLKKRL
jgi:hypothetical protein